MTPTLTAKPTAAATPTEAPTATPTITPTPTPALTPTPLPADAHQDLRPLIALYNSTNGRNWRNNDNWLTDRPLYDWFGLKVNTDGRVTEIDLSANGVEGSLPPELGDLDQLQRLIIGYSGLSGVIPREFGQLTKLEYLFLNGNDLTGPIPHELGLLPNLTRIEFDYNELSGELPPSLLTSETITTISIRDNDLTGPIPSEVTERSRLQFLVLAENRLTGEIPPEIGRLWNLRELWLHHNQLTGNIPREIGRLQNLGSLFLNDNQLTGDIPPSIAQLYRLTSFSVANNQLTGSIPNGIARLSDLQQLDMDGNRLTGTIPEGLGNLEQLERLGIVGNDFSGCVPKSLRNIESNNIGFANIPVCGQPDRTAPVIPAYIEFALGDAVTPSYILAIELGAQWLNEFITDLGWPTPETTITVYVDDEAGLVRDLAAYAHDCNLGCARLAINDTESTARRGAAFVPLVGQDWDNALDRQARSTARLILHAIRIEIVDKQLSNGYDRAPRWWSDGLATLLADLAVAEGMGQPRDERRRDIAYWSSRDFVPLWELEGGATTWPTNRGAAAVDLLASQVGLRKLNDFYTERIDGEDWRQTFQRVFNISVPDFYELFNQHHRNGYLLRDLSRDGTTQWP